MVKRFRGPKKKLRRQYHENEVSVRQSKVTAGRE